MRPVVVIHNFSDFVWAFLAALFGYVLSFLTPIAPFLYFTGAVVIVDLYTGARAAKKRGEAFVDIGVAKTISKTTDYFIAIMVAEGIRRVFYESFPAPYIVAALIALRESKSVFNHLKETTGIDFWAQIGDLITNRLGKKKAEEEAKTPTKQPKEKQYEKHNNP